MSKIKKYNIIMKIFVMILLLALVFDYNLMGAYALNFDVPDKTYLISKTDKRIAPGITESEIITNDESGNNQNIDYACEIDLSKDSKTKIISGYGNYIPDTWRMDTVSNQAKAAEKGAFVT